MFVVRAFSRGGTACEVDARELAAARLRAPRRTRAAVIVPGPWGAYSPLSAPRASGRRRILESAALQNKPIQTADLRGKVRSILTPCGLT